MVKGGCWGEKSENQSEKERMKQLVNGEKAMYNLSIDLFVHLSIGVNNKGS